MSIQPFNIRIQEVRKLLGETQTEFGERFGVGPMTVSYWEKGRHDAPNKVLAFIEEQMSHRKTCPHCQGRGWLEREDK